MKGAKPEAEGDVNDHRGKGPLGGMPASHFDVKLITTVEDNTTAGNARPHGVILGELHTCGTVGECPRACNLGVNAAAEGTGDYGREHTIGGAVSTSGLIGCNPVVGTSGGAVHARDKLGDPELKSNLESADSDFTE